MRHRVFIAINLPENVKNKLSSYQEKWPELPIRWTKKENLREFTYHFNLSWLSFR
jgi:2'-5' RNA ligase